MNDDDDDDDGDKFYFINQKCNDCRFDFEVIFPPPSEIKW